MKTHVVNDPHLQIVTASPSVRKRLVNIVARAKLLSPVLRHSECD